MPELPEVESVRRALEASILNQTIEDCEVRLPKIVAGKGAMRKDLPVDVEAFCKFCTGRTIQAVSRRAKNIMLELDEGLLLVHFKMSGQLLWLKDKKEVAAEKYIHIVWRLTDGYLVYKDLRQFGYVLPYSDKSALKEHFADLGVEPLGPDYELEPFKTQMKKKKAILKKIFLDQTVVVGLGNIYADEVCHYARVKPTRKANTLTDQELEELYYGARSILAQSIEVGGTTKYTHTLPDGQQGRYTEQLQVYGRGGEKCFRDGAILTRETVAGRTTVWCETCQK